MCNIIRAYIRVNIFLNIKVKMMGGITARKRVIIKGKHCNRNENKY